MVIDSKKGGVGNDTYLARDSEHIAEAIIQ